MPTAGTPADCASSNAAAINGFVARRRPAAIGHADQDPRTRAGHDQPSSAPAHAVAPPTSPAPASDAFGNTRANLALEAVIDRTEWGMNWNAALPSGGNALGNEVALTISLSLVEQA